MKKTFTYSLFLIFLFSLVSCSQGNFETTPNGVIVKPDAGMGLAAQINVEVVNDKIIHVFASPSIETPKKESLIVTAQSDNTTKFTVSEENGKAIISTSELTAEISLSTGEVVFKNKSGEILLKEKDGGGKTFSQVEVEGKNFYSVKQIFDSPDDEAFYGLGQHQNGQMNYKGQDVELAQHNIVAVNPFLYSNKNYGILWDNYSITRFGDEREYQPISNLQLFDKEGNEGGLTVDYFKGDVVEVSRQENTINYQYLDDPNEWPEGHSANATSKVVWEGQISSATGGVHKFKHYGSEYFKIWIDGELIMDRWRQNWNPWYHPFNVNMATNEKHDIKIEWIPNGGYIALLHLDPLTEKEQNDLTLSSEVANEIDYYFVVGNDADDVIGGYRYLTGKAVMLPKWAFGFWQSRERYKSQDELLEVVKEYRKRQIPLDNIVLDWSYWPVDKWGSHEFDENFFPDAEEMVKQLHEEYNANIMISIWPKFYPGTDNFNELNEKGFLYQRNLDKKERDWIGEGYYSTFYDPFSKGAGEIFWRQIEENLNSKGFDAWWLDATEPDMHSNLSITERKLRMSPTGMGPGAQFFNAFSLMNSKGVYEGERKSDPDKRAFILTRSAFAGQQRYASVTWSGDVVSRWSNLKEQIAAGINFSLAGIPYWTTDIGGFSTEGRYAREEKEHIPEWRELNTRWFQFGAFSPLFRSHGQYPFREIYNIAPEGSEEFNSLVYYDKLRYRLFPHIYSMVGQVYQNDYTIMRGLIMDFGQDENVANIADQYMFGPSILVNPVYEFGARSREVYLPSGNGWYDFYTGNYQKGGQTISAEAPLSRIPLFVKEGSIVPVGPDLQYTDEKPADEITLLVYTGKDAEFTIYEDEGINYNYEEGKFSSIDVKYSEQDKTITIENIKGEFNGMLKKRKFNIVFISKEKPVPYGDTIPFDKMVEYKGEKVVINKN